MEDKETLKKTISINPNFFKTTNIPKNKSKKKPKTEIKTSAPLKKALLGKIKNHAKQRNKTIKKNKDKSELTFQDHLDYLENLSSKIKVNTSLPKELKPNNNLLPVSLINSSNPVSAPSMPEPAMPEPAMSEPAMPEPAKPEPAKPEPANPEPAKPEPAKPEPAMSAPAKPEPAMPAPAMPEPAMPEPAMPEPSRLEKSISINTNPIKQSSNPLPDFSINLESIKLKEAPPYGILKTGGKKPTYRQWSKTRKNKPQYEKIITREKKKKYTLGKHNNKVSIFIKNRETRKNIKNEVKTLKKRPIFEVKDYLRKHNFIKGGSEAPNDVMREMYENIHLSGEINNKNSDNLIHNFLKEDEN